MNKALVNRQINSSNQSSRKELTTMTISIGQGNQRSWKQSNARHLFTGFLTMIAAVAVVAGALLWQGTDSATVIEAPKEYFRTSTYQEFAPKTYYLVNSEEEGLALMADSDAEAFNHVFFIDMSKPGSAEFVNVLNYDIGAAAEMGYPVSTVIVDAR